MSIWLFLLSQFAIISYALVGGVFLAFSDFIMRSLAHTSGGVGAEAMQVINKEVFRWVFMALFLGLVPISVVLAVYGFLSLGTPAGTLFLLAAAIYLIGCFLVTVMFNVPMNEALAAMDTASATTADYWSGTYVPRWTFWNSVRTAASTIAAALMLFGLLWMAQSQPA
ncbi:MAG: anthrone oxygenase family protein [Pseudomonadota bacterium]